MANELEIGAGLKLSNPAPADGWRSLPQVGAARSRGYASVADACAKVANAVRYDGMTVYVTGLGEYWWQYPDYSDAGLVEKTSSTTGPPVVAGGGGIKPYSLNANTQAKKGEQHSYGLKVWEVKQDFTANAAPAPGANWLLVFDATPVYETGPGSSAGTAMSQQATTAALAKTERGAGYFVFATYAAMLAATMPESADWRKPGAKANVYADRTGTGENNGEYFVAPDGVTLTKVTATPAQVVEALSTLTESSDVRKDASFKHTLGTSRLWTANKDQRRVGAGPFPPMVFPVEADATFPGGQYWVETSAAAVTNNSTGGGAGYTDAQVDVRILAKTANNNTTTAAGLVADARQIKNIWDYLNPVLPTPAYSANLTINAGNALGAVVGPILLTGDVANLSVTLINGAMLEVLFQANGADRAITLNSSYVSANDNGAALKTTNTPKDTIKRVILEKTNNVTYFFVVK